MGHKIIILLLAVATLLPATTACAGMSEEAKIERLISTIREMPEGTLFIRNGGEYESGRAADHLRTKYARGKKYAATAELFIENIASRSSFSGEEYSIRYVDGTTVTAREFFTDMLRKIEKGDTIAP